VPRRHSETGASRGWRAVFYIGERCRQNPWASRASGDRKHRMKTSHMLALGIGLVSCAAAAVSVLHAAGSGGGARPAVASAPNPPAAKKLIEFGWDRPTPDFIRQNAGRIDSSPFDGLVATLHVGAKIFTHQPYPALEFERDRTDLAAARLSRVTENFLLVWGTTETTWDWFSDADWQAAMVNLRNFARTARDGRCRGLFFDTEPYGPNPWYYLAQPRRSEKSFAEYERQVQARGAEFIQVLQQEMPDAIVFMTWGPITALPRQQPVQDLTSRARFREREGFGLLAAFVDGALHAISSKAEIVDGNERSYFFVHDTDFVESTSVKDRADPVDLDASNLRRYHAQYRFANAVWVDWIMDAGTDPSLLGYYLPAEKDRLALLEHHTFTALANSDRYAWIYAQKTNWWAGAPPPALIAALARAKHDANEALPGVPLNPAIEQANQRYLSRIRIRGTVQHNGVGLGGVSMRSGEADCATTNADGYYECTFPSGWTGTITPHMGSLRFAPPNRTYSAPSAREVAQSFAVSD
jgi:hypothetical protein